jgi:hypothetical protein
LQALIDFPLVRENQSPFFIMQPASSHSSRIPFLAGAATRDITPDGSVFLFGYPRVPRNSTGVHDRLETSVLYLRDVDGRALLFISSDLIFVGKQLAGAVRRRINATTGVPVKAITVTATHTHSGPVPVNYASNAADPVVPKADEAYLALVADKMVDAALAAISNPAPAELGLVVATANGVGTNRHDPAGPADPDVPVLVARSAATREPLACMIVYAMHPTILHEDSTLISADFPHFTRARLRERGLVPALCPILYHNGAAGNQSPRHVTRENTFAEARRVGGLLGDAIAKAIPGIAFHDDIRLSARHAFVELTPRKMPSAHQAGENARSARTRLDYLMKSNAPRALTRTAECDWFGTEETVVLARAAESGRLARVVTDCSPAEIQVLEIGPWKFVAWPGEFFVEYALEVRTRDPKTFVITYANGELQGYIVTPEAATKNVYEATNALFAPESGKHVVNATLRLLGGTHA